MKKTLCFILSVLLFSLCPLAFAEGTSADNWHPILEDGLPEYNMPPIPDGYEDEFFIPGQKNYGVMQSDKIITTVTESGDYFTGMTWTVSASGGSGNYIYSFFVVKGKNENGKINYYQSPNGIQKKTSSNTFTYIFPENGLYQLWVDVYDLEESTYNRKIIPYTVEVAGHEAMDFTVSMSGTPFNGPLTWTVNPVGGSGQYKYFIYLSCPALTFGDTKTITYNKDATTRNTLSYELVMSADYELQVWLKDTNTENTVYKSFPYSFHSSEYPPLEVKVNEIVSQCLAAGCTTDYQKALWLHDWLTLNADYDNNYVHYGPDGVLLCGSGVCDSYSKAFCLLANAAGLDAARVINVVHAWNAVQIDGQWCYLDATWDDPGQGNEYHLYFGIPFEIMAIDHPNFTDRYNCTTYVNSYYYNTPEFGQAWGAALAGAIQEELQNGIYDFYVPLAGEYSAEGYTFSNRNTPGTVLADNLSLLFAGNYSYSFGVKPVSLFLNKVEYDTYYVEAYVDFAEKHLILPENQEVIGAEAFMGNQSIRYAVLPDMVTEIGERAFAGCDDLWAVTIESFDAAFGKDVFDRDNGHLLLLVYPGSTAEDYADSNGLRYSYIMPEEGDEVPDYPINPTVH